MLRLASGFASFSRRLLRSPAFTAAVPTTWPTPRGVFQSSDPWSQRSTRVLSSQASDDTEPPKLRGDPKRWSAEEVQQFFTTVRGGMYAQYASVLEGFNGAGLGDLREEHFLRRCPEMGDAMYGAWQEKLSLAQYKPTAGYQLDATQLDFMFNWQARDEFEATCKKQLVKLKTFFKKKPGPEPDWRLLGYLVVYGGRGTGKTRAGYQLAVHLRTKGDLPVRHTFFDAENYRFSDDLLSSGEERPTADRLLALLLSDFQTDDMTEALEMVKAVRQDLPASVVPGVDRSKGLVVLLQVDEFLIQAKGPTSPVTALMRSVRDHRRAFLEHGVILLPVLTGFRLPDDVRDTVEEMEFGASGYPGKKVRLEPLTLDQAIKCVRWSLQQSNKTLTNDHINELIVGCGGIPRFLGFAFQEMDAWSVTSSHIKDKYSSVYEKLGKSRCLLFEVALDKWKYEENRTESVDGHTLEELYGMGVVYVDKDDCVMLPKLLWEAVGGDDLNTVLGVVSDSKLGRVMSLVDAKHDGGGWYEDAVVCGMAMRASLLFVKVRANLAGEGEKVRKKIPDEVWTTLGPSTQTPDQLSKALHQAGVTCQVRDLLPPPSPSTRVHQQTPDADDFRHGLETLRLVVTDKKKELETKEHSQKLDDDIKAADETLEEVEKLLEAHKTIQPEHYFLTLDTKKVVVPRVHVVDNPGFPTAWKDFTLDNGVGKVVRALPKSPSSDAVLVLPGCESDKPVGVLPLQFKKSKDVEKPIPRLPAHIEYVKMVGLVRGAAALASLFPDKDEFREHLAKVLAPGAVRLKAAWEADKQLQDMPVLPLIVSTMREAVADEDLPLGCGYVNSESVCGNVLPLEGDWETLQGVDWQVERERRD